MPLNYISIILVVITAFNNTIGYLLFLSMSLLSFMVYTYYQARRPSFETIAMKFPQLTDVDIYILWKHYLPIYHGRRAENISGGFSVVQFSSMLMIIIELVNREWIYAVPLVVVCVISMAISHRLNPQRFYAIKNNDKEAGYVPSAMEIEILMMRSVIEKINAIDASEFITPTSSR